MRRIDIIAVAVSLLALLISVYALGREQGFKAGMEVCVPQGSR